MVRKFCNKCFKFQDEDVNLQLIVYQCFHVCCMKCVDRNQPKICIVCGMSSKPVKWENQLEYSKEPKFLEMAYRKSIAFEHTQQNMLFHRMHEMADAVEGFKQKMSAELQQDKQIESEIKKLKEKKEKTDAYIAYYEKYDEGTLTDQEKLNRPITPTDSEAEDDEDDEPTQNHETDEISSFFRSIDVVQQKRE